jgi:hypothetical protein
MKVSNVVLKLVMTDLNSDVSIWLVASRFSHGRLLVTATCFYLNFFLTSILILDA